MQTGYSQCQYDYQMVAGALDSYPVIASSTCEHFTLATSTPDVATYHDIAFFGATALFLLAFVPMSVLWSVFTRKK